MEISNKTLAALLIVAIIISVGGAMMTITQVTNLVNIIPELKGITGLGSVGRVNVTVTSLASLDVVRANVDFGIGYLAAGQTNAILNSSNASPVEWTVESSSWAAKDLQLANTGTVDINVSVQSDKTGATMIGGGAGAIPDPYLKFRAYNNVSSSCIKPQNLTEFATAAVDIEACANLSYFDTADSINVSIVLLIPQDVAQGNKTATLTFTATRRT